MTRLDLARWKPITERMVFLTAIGATWLIAFPAALVTSKLYWGYFFARPPLDSRVEGATRVFSATPFQRSADGVLAPRDHPLDAERLARIDRDSTDEAFTNRAVRHVYRAGLLTASTPSLPALELEELGRKVFAKVELVEGEPGYRNATRLYGHLLELHGPDGQPLFLLAASSSEVSNDHHAFYELVFSREDPGVGELLAGTQFFFDVAGIEGAEWPALTIVFGLLLSALVIPLTLIVLLWTGWRNLRKMGHTEDRLDVS